MARVSSDRRELQVEEAFAAIGSSKATEKRTFDVSRSRSITPC